MCRLVLIGLQQNLINVVEVLSAVLALNYREDLFAIALHDFVGEILIGISHDLVYVRSLIGLFLQQSLQNKCV
jgi:hypothetical protein